MTPTMLQNALRYAAAGLSVVPWAYNGDSKTTTRRWKLGEVERMSWEEIRQWWGQRPSDNVGVLTGEPSGLVVVDLDNPAAIAWAKASLPSTDWVVTTGRGEQWGYRDPGSIRNRADVFSAGADSLMPKVDVRGTGGYVAMPPSIHKTGVEYRWASGSMPDVLDLPLFQASWLPSKEEAENVAIELDDGLLGDVSSARMWLSDEPACISGQGGQKQIFRVCCALLRDFALSWSEAWELLAEYNARCEPEWSHEELAHNLKGAISRGSTQRGSRRVPHSPTELRHLEEVEFAWWFERKKAGIKPAMTSLEAPAPAVAAATVARPVAPVFVQAAAPVGQDPVLTFLEKLAAEGASSPGAFFRAENLSRLAAISLTDAEHYHNFMKDVKKHVSAVDLRKAIVRAQKEMRQAMMRPAQADAAQETKEQRDRVVISGDERSDRDSILSILKQAEGVYVSSYKLSYVDSTAKMGLLAGGSLRNVIANNCYLANAIPRDDGTLAYKPASLPANILSMLENLLPAELEGLRRVDQVARAPIFTPSGDFIKEPGYVPETRTLITECPPIDMDSFPTQRQALDYIESIFKDFPFASQDEWANYLGALLTPMLRHMYHGPTPWLLIEANTPGAGKSLLGKCIQILYGYNANTNELPSEEKEIAKTLVAVLRTAKPVIIFDNVKTVIDSASIEAVATSSDEYEARFLGVHDVVTCTVRALFIVTSNNARMGVDAARRFIRVRLVKNQLTRASTDKPKFRITDIERYVAENRAKILSAVARIALDWVSEGAPVKEGLLTIPSFEAFSHTVGACLAHAGVAGWGRNSIEMVRNMQSLDEWVPFCQEWYNRHKVEDQSRTKPVFAADLFTQLVQGKSLLGFTLSYAKDEPAKRSLLGTKLAERRDAPIGDFIIHTEWYEHRKVNRYWLERIEGEDDKSVSPESKKLMH